MFSLLSQNPFLYSEIKRAQLIVGLIPKMLDGREGADCNLI